MRLINYSFAVSDVSLLCRGALRKEEAEVFDIGKAYAQSKGHGWYHGGPRLTVLNHCSVIATCDEVKGIEIQWSYEY